MDMFLAIADPTRRTIIELLVSKGKLSATEISRKFEMSVPAVSQHLKVLREADIVNVEKQAQFRIYTINTVKMMELATWIHTLTQQWNNRLDRLEEFLEQEKIMKGGEIHGRK